MAITVKTRGLGAIAVAVGIGIVLAGCSSSGTPADTASSSAETDALGTPNKATGDPIIFGALNLESGPVAFPEVLAAEKAAVEYINEYQGGIAGHPVQIASCATDGTPATSQRCANQIVDQKPVAIFGAADVGGPGSFPVWERAGLAYVGGVPFTPVEQNSPNSVIFASVSTADNAAASVYAAQTLNAKSAAVIYTSNTQGTSIAEGVIIPTMKNAGITEITKVPIPETASDVSSAVATAVGANPDVIYINAPAACPNILSSLKQLGNTAKLMGIEPCTSPPALKGANGGAEGLYYASPMTLASSDDPEAATFRAAMAKYAPDAVLDSLSVFGFQTVMNAQAALKDFAVADLTKDKILAAFTSGTDHHSFMGHDYTCDGKQLAGATAICSAYQKMFQIKNNAATVVDDNWVTPGSYYQPVAP